MLQTSSSAGEIERHYAGQLETAAVRVSVSVEDVAHVRVDMFERGEAAGWDPRCR